MSDPTRLLRDLAPARGFFVGIDSDGCAFDTMEIKHKECFIPNIINCWDLQAVAKFAREAAEYVNLYSINRGVNRFPGLVMVFDLLAERPEVIRRGVRLPEVPALRAWIQRETRLGNPALQAEAHKTGDPGLARALAWSEAVNRAIGEIVRGVPPFPFVRESLEKLAPRADIVVVSATPGEALAREWREHRIDGYARAIAGQELGSKKEHLTLAAGGKYPPEGILMIGDAPGDLSAGRAVGALFYPIVHGHEDASWERFFSEGADRFFAGTYAGAYEDARIEEFLKVLPEAPPWRT